MPKQIVFSDIPLSVCRRRLLSAVVLAVGLVATNTTAAQNRAALVIVSTAQQSEVIEEVPLTGSVVSARQASLSTEISGLIEAINVDIGEQVATGNVLLTLKSDLEALSLQASRARVEQAERELKDARRRLADAERLGQTNTVSINTINSLQAEVSIDAAEVTRLMAEQDRQQLRLQQHQLKAPFGGIISDRHVEIGEWVNPGQPVVELVSLQSPIIEFRVPQRIYQELDKVTSINVALAALPGEVFKASIETVVPVTDRSSRTFLLRARLGEPDTRLIPGLSASAVMRLRNSASGVVVDRNALIRYPDGRVTVWVVIDDDNETVVTEKLVRTGLTFDGRVNIVEGLDVGERVVVNGNESLREGQAVSIQGGS